LTRAATEIPVCLSAFNKSKLRRRVSYFFDVDRVTYVSAAMAEEDTDSRLGVAHPDITVAPHSQSQSILLCDALYILIIPLTEFGTRKT